MAEQLYEFVPASTSEQTIGDTGALGDVIDFLLVIPTTLSPGNVQIKDGSNTPITVFAGGAGSISNLIPFTIPLAARSRSGSWKVTTGAGLSVVAVGVAN